MTRATSLIAFNGAVLALGAAGILAACLFGPAGIGPLDSISALFGGGDPRHEIVVRDIRLPRALAAYLTGAALAASGAALQGLLRNPLADPGVLGVSSSAALGAVLAIYFDFSAGGLGAPLGAVVFALAATALLVLLGAGRLSTMRLVLVGVGLSAFVGALISLAMNLAPNPFVLSDLVNWLFGSVANRSFPDLALAAPIITAGLILVLASGGGLSALSLGEETAASIGADVARLRILAIAGAALLAGGGVALAGAVGFVGVVAPHLARPFAGHDPGKTVLPAALVGGTILLAADLVIRLLPFDQELKLGVAAALIGGPVFVAIAARAARLAP